MQKSKSQRLPLFIAYASYIFLGMPMGLLNIAWPSIRESFGLPLDALGTLLLAVTAGYMLSSFFNGQLMAWLGTGRLLMTSSLLIGGGALGYVLAPAWWAMVVFGFVLGLGNGIVDAALNTFVAKHYQSRHMNWLHAFFGIGTFLGPLVITAILGAGLGWRPAYLVVVVPEVILATVFYLTRQRFDDTTVSPEGEGSEIPVTRTSSLVSLRMAAVWLGIALFVIHPGIESVAPQWGYPLFTEARNIDTTTASLWISIYWGALTAGRLVLGAVSDRIGVEQLLRLCMILILLGSILIWANLGQLVSFLALAVIGFGIAPMFPSMISLTPKWVGQAHTPNAIGFQVAAASIGIAALPGLSGVLAERRGLEIIGPLLVVCTVVMIALYEITVRFAARKAAGKAEQSPAAP